MQERFIPPIKGRVFSLQKIKKLLEVVFPPFCWHCDEPATLSQPLCPSCVKLLDILPPADPLVTFEGQGPAWTLIKALKSGKAPRLAEGLAGYMALQYLKSDLPLPDIIVPVPQSLHRSLQVGYNPALLLAQHLGKTLDLPVLQLLKRKRQLFCQMKVDRDRRYLLSAENFQWKKRMPIAEKTILLVDDIVGIGATLRASAQRLYEGFPLKVIKMGCVAEG
jgi:predicted amidophosphoribosyltransferase